jgi:coenzyme F420-dependent glucose-6-phosphate dehydrogenase
MTIEFGYTLSSEEQAPRDLVAQAVEAETRGFEFAGISDHFHPWVEAQGHSPFVWSVLGAIAARTDELRVGVGVTCPIVRIHPGIVAQASATTSLLFGGDDRFFLGVGTGEALNEHIFGDPWPRPEIRRRMLAEAVEVIRLLWSGDTIDFEGEHYDLDNARLFDPPESPPPIVVSGFGPAAAELAGAIGDGYWGTAPDASLLDEFERAGGKGPRYAQVSLCWAPNEDAAREIVARQWPTAGLSGQLAQDLPTWTHFEMATKPLTPEQITESVPCGPDVKPILESVDAYRDAGYDHVYFHQIGPDQDGFFDFWSSELQPALAS